MRLFVAAELPPAHAQALAAWGARVAGADPALRAVAAEALHVTLAFLGERPDREAGVIADALDAAVDGAPWPAGLRVGGVLWLAPRRPHVLTVELHDPAGALGELQSAVARALGEAVGYAPDHRRFRPHVTVCRVRRGPRPRLELDAPLPELDAFDVPAVTLMRSRLGRGPARYEAVHRRTR